MAVGNRIAIYNRTTYIEQRRVVMDWWESMLIPPEWRNASG